MPISEIQAKTLLRKFHKIEGWFLCRYGMNLYRGCAHNCIYCDGRAEKYYVEGDFGTDIAVKINASELLDKELDPSHRRKPLKRGFVVLGGGVCDAYQPIEKQYKITRSALSVIAKHNYPVHVLTKSTLVARDIDILKIINASHTAIVSMSFSSVDPEISRFLEPGVPPPSERLKILYEMKQTGIAVGMFLMPVVPGLTDTEENIDQSVKAAQDAGLDFVIFSGMTLKEGRQKAYFMERLEQLNPDIAEKYPVIYRGDKYGAAVPAYYRKISRRFFESAKKYRISVRIPQYIWDREIEIDDRILVLLEHIDSMLMLRGEKSPFGRAAWTLSKHTDLLEMIRNRTLSSLHGVSPRVAGVILEIAETGTSALYGKLCSFSR